MLAALPPASSCAAPGASPAYPGCPLPPRQACSYERGATGAGHLAAGMRALGQGGGPPDGASLGLSAAAGTGVACGRPPPLDHLDAGDALTKAATADVGVQTDEAAHACASLLLLELRAKDEALRAKDEEVGALKARIAKLEARLQ